MIRMCEDHPVAAEKCILHYIHGSCHLFALSFSHANPGATIHILWDDAPVFDGDDQPEGVSVVSHVFVEIGGLLYDARGEICKSEIDDIYGALCICPRYEKSSIEEISGMMVSGFLDNYADDESEQLSKYLDDTAFAYLPQETIVNDIESVAEWLCCDENSVSIKTKSLPISLFMGQIDGMESTYDEFPDDRERTEIILQKLINGEAPLPIFIEKGDKAKFVMEGRHRMVAFKKFGLDMIPVAICESCS